MKMKETPKEKSSVKHQRTSKVKEVIHYIQLRPGS